MNDYTIPTNYAKAVRLKGEGFEPGEWKNKPTPAVDVYALANLVYMVVSDRVHPLQLEEETHLTPQKWIERIHLQQRPRALHELAPAVTPELEAILLQALSYKPEKRPTAKKLSDGLRKELQEIPRFRIYVCTSQDVGEEYYLFERHLNYIKADYQNDLRITWNCQTGASIENRVSAISQGHLILFIAWYPTKDELAVLEEDFKEAVHLYEKGLGTKPTSPGQQPAPIWFFQKTGSAVALAGDSAEATQEYVSRTKALTSFLDEAFSQRMVSNLFRREEFKASSNFGFLLEERLESFLKARFPNIQPKPTQRLENSVSPFRGLKPFTLEHAQIFFGRDRAISNVVMALRQQAAKNCSFILIQGMSGSGKSSLAQAGVLHRLMQPGVIPEVDSWQYAILEPGKSTGNLIEYLATGLTEKRALPELLSDGTSAKDIAERLTSNPGNAYGLIKGVLAQVGMAVETRDKKSHQPRIRLALVIDQLEGIFTSDLITPFQRQQFLAILAELARSDGLVWVMATLRSDFYHHCEGHDDLMKLKEGAGQYHLAPPTADEIRQIICRPARMAGVAFGRNPRTGRLLDVEIAEAMRSNSESLPLAQLALDELFRHG